MCRSDLVWICGRRDSAGTQCQFGQQQAVGPSDWDAARMKPTEGAAGAGENVTDGAGGGGERQGSCAVTMWSTEA